MYLIFSLLKIVVELQNHQILQRPSPMTKNVHKTNVYLQIFLKDDVETKEGWWKTGK